MNRTYRELFLDQDFSHLAKTVDCYLSTQTPVWWVEVIGTPGTPTSPVGCPWLGNAIDRVEGARVTHIFLLYVSVLLNLPKLTHTGIVRSSGSSVPASRIYH